MKKAPGTSFDQADLPEVVLEGRRAEFREALREEIEAANRASHSGAVPLRDGRRIGQVGAAFQYGFQVESALQLPDDSPGDLIVDGHAHEATVISVSGLAITLSVPRDLGSFVPFARLQSNLTHLMRKLVERIEAIGDGENPGGDRLLDGPLSGELADVDAGELNERQHQALKAAVGRDLTFIWGPPGTGKTHTIGAIGTELFREGRSLLLVSHTNVALDQALLKIGRALEAMDSAALSDGLVFRVGTPRDKTLAETPDLLLATHRRRRSEELEARRDELQDERRDLERSVLDLTRQIDIREWVDARADLDRLRAEIRRLVELRAEATVLGRQARALADRAPALRAAAEAASDPLVQDAAIQQARERLDQATSSVDASEQAARIALSVHHKATDALVSGDSLRLDEEEARLGGSLRDLASAFNSARTDLAAARALVPETERLEPHRVALETLPSQTAQRQVVTDLQREASEVEAQHREAVTAQEESQALLGEAERTGGLLRRVRGLPDPETQRGVAREATQRAIDLAERLEQAKTALSDGEALLTRILQETQIVAGHDALPRVSDLRARVRALEQAETDALGRVERTLESLGDEAVARVERARGERNAALGDLEAREAASSAFQARFLASPTQVAARAAAGLAELDGLRQRAEAAHAAVSTHEGPLRDEVSRTINALREWGLTDAAGGDTVTLADAVFAAHAAAKAATRELVIPRARQQIADWNIRMVAIDVEIEQITKALEDVESLLIAEARIIAVTLTSAYLRDEIQARTFNTVLLDEASMAPIPALWVAASRAEKNVVAVGDDRQLPPICLSDKEPATTWLGQDIFTVSDAYDEAAKDDPASPIVQLLVQHRMHPLISRIPNMKIYGGDLQDGPGVTDETELETFHQCPWEPDSPVSLIDTGSLDAWVTSVSRGGGASRINFLSATVCVDLAEAMLHPDRPELDVGDAPRILIVTPYRAQAKLLSLMLKENGIDREVRAGTAHSFQGSEAPVVLLDLVNDEPHWKVGMFMPKANDDYKRLFNVAMTRAERRLLIVGDIDYIAKSAKKAFAGELLRDLLAWGTPRLEARRLVPTGLSARAAAASRLAHGAPDIAGERLVVTQADFYPHLATDLARAEQRVVIYSPFITTSRLAEIEPHIKAVTERAVPVWVITKPLNDRPKGDAGIYRQLEDTLRGWGVRVIHKAKMHEKLVFIDDKLLWQGSLNPLSFRDTGEVMERRTNPEVVQEYWQVLQADQLLGPFMSTTNERICPCCGAELQAAEGTNEPFYWQCSRDPHCYSRNAGEPPPQDGRIVCNRCGGRYELSKRGDQDVWKCTEDRRHWRRLRSGDLRLPRMREGIPARTLKRLLREMDIDQDPQQTLL